MFISTNYRELNWLSKGEYWRYFPYILVQRNLNRLSQTMWRSSMQPSSSKLCFSIIAGTLSETLKINGMHYFVIAWEDLPESKNHHAFKSKLQHISILNEYDILNNTSLLFLIADKISYNFVICDRNSQLYMAEILSIRR